MKIALFDSKTYDKKWFNKLNKAHHQITYIQTDLTSESAKLAANHDAVCCFVNSDGSAEVLQMLHDLHIKYWLQRAAGFDKIDIASAHKLNMRVFRVPSYSPETVAEHAMTLMTAVNRNIHLASNRTKIGNFNLDGLTGEHMYNSVIGVIGAGRIGQAFIRIAKGYGAQVLAFDEYAQAHFPETAQQLGFRYVSKTELMKCSDYISLHAPLNDDTHYIINKAMIALMKPNVIIVNTSRGGLINTEDLIYGLDNGKIRGAGIDVYEKESGYFFIDHQNDIVKDRTLSRLMLHRNVILTSHQAFFTNIALHEIAESVFTTIDHLEANKKPIASEIMGA